MSGSFIEGWAVHAERLMAEAGFGGRAVRLQQLKMQLRMTINAILDVRGSCGSDDRASCDGADDDAGASKRRARRRASGGAPVSRLLSCLPTSSATASYPTC